MGMVGGRVCIKWRLAPVLLEKWKGEDQIMGGAILGTRQQSTVCCWEKVVCNGVQEEDARTRSRVTTLVIRTNMTYLT